MGTAAMVPAQAAEATDNGGWNWYYSAGIPLTDLQTDGFKATAAAAGVSLGGDGDIGETTIGGQGTLGVMVTPRFGVELRYSASGNARDKPDVLNSTNPTLLRTTGSTSFSIDGFTLAAVGRWPLHERIDLLTKIGYAIQDLELDASLPTNPKDPANPVANISVRDDDDGFVADLGLRLKMGERWAVTAELEFIAIDFDGRLEEPLRGSINLEYGF